MQSAYVEQIPAGAKPPQASPPVLKIVPDAAPGPQRPAPPGLYVQVAAVTGQQQALQAGLDLAQRLGPDRPAFIRGVGAVVDGRPRIRMFAGPFAGAAAASRFCALAIPDQACTEQVFPPASAVHAAPSQRRGPTSAGPRGEGD